MTRVAPLEVKAQVVSVAVVPGEAFRAVLGAPEIARDAKPLQFVNVKIGEGPYPFLRRPYSLSHFSAEDGFIEITWSVVGEGSQMMTAWKPDMKVSVLGPLGNGFVPKDSRGVTAARPPKMLLLAGGTGLAPMYPLAALAASMGWDPRLLYGTRSLSTLLDTKRFERAGCPVEIATEDGSCGIRGRVTDILVPAMDDLGPGDVAVACGPVPMLRAVKSLFRAEGGNGKQIPLYVSLESRMACGTGLCKGCAVPASAGTAQGEPRYLHVCTDGPVFDADEVDLEGVPA